MIATRLRFSFAFMLALAACGGHHHANTVGNGGHDMPPGQTLAVEIGMAPDDGSGQEWGTTLLPAKGSQFPAVSSDGTTIVDLVRDAQDFSGIPIATLVFWTKDGKPEMFRLTSNLPEDGDAPDARLNEEQGVLELANARLATQRWKPLAAGTLHEDEETGENATLTLADGTVIQLNAIRDDFPAPGDGSAEMGEPGGCGDITGIEAGYGSKELGFAVVFPRANLGGDSCFGKPSADLAIVVPVK